MKRWKATWIVLGILALLAAYVLLIETKRQPTPSDPDDPEAAPTPVPLLELEVSNIQSLHIDGGERTLHVERKGKTWWVTMPENREADFYSVHLALEDLARLEATRVLLEQVSDLAEYGLAPAHLTLSIQSLSGQEKIAVGRQTPDGMHYYVQRHGDARLYLVRQYVLQPFFNWLHQPPYPLVPTPET